MYRGRSMARTHYPIPVVDVFAGPGGLGEGFSSLRSQSGGFAFRLGLSVEKDKIAHDTLRLRAFYRQFADDARPDGYYEYLRNPTPEGLLQLYSDYPREAEAADSEAWWCELSEESSFEVEQRVAAVAAQSNQWVLIGGPPCQAYSIVGRSRRSREARHVFESDPRQKLYLYYLSLLAYQPAVFVMENVKGLLSAKLGGESLFGLIRRDLHDAGYRVFSPVVDDREPDELTSSDFVIESERYGIPQTRHRVILLGVRQDIARAPKALKPYGSLVTVEDVIGGLPRIRSRISPNGHGFDDSARQWNEIVSTALADLSQTGSSLLSTGGSWIGAACQSGAHEWWYNRDQKLRAVLNHESKAHMVSDLNRYCFCSQHAESEGRSPLLRDFPESLMPAHKNAKSSADSGDMFDDRFRVQRWLAPATTITSHIAKDGHYYIHPDPWQCRSLTVREAARIQTFPDDYFFEGSRTSQYQQVGNAVPPLLARQLAAVVAELLGRDSEPAFPKSHG